jgi:hypothetical protein
VAPLLFPGVAAGGALLLLAILVGKPESEDVGGVVVMGPAR